VTTVNPGGKRREKKKSFVPKGTALVPAPRTRRGGRWVKGKGNTSFTKGKGGKGEKNSSMTKKMVG